MASLINGPPQAVPLKNDPDESDFQPLHVREEFNHLMRAKVLGDKYPTGMPPFLFMVTEKMEGHMEGVAWVVWWFYDGR